MFVTVGRSSWIPVNKVSHLFSNRDSLVDSLWLSWRQPLICFLFLLSGEKIFTLTSHREGPFRNLDFRISRSNHISLCFRYGVLPYLSSTPRGGLGTFWRRICTAPSAFGRPAFFMAGPRITEVSLSGSTRRLSYSVFKVLRWSLVKAYQKVFRSGSDS